MARRSGKPATAGRGKRSGRRAKDSAPGEDTAPEASARAGPGPDDEPLEAAPSPDAPPPAETDDVAAQDEDQPGRFARAAMVGATVLRHREIFTQALDLLRRTRAVSAQDQARILAAYEEGTGEIRSELSRLLDKLQTAQFGEVVVDLARHRDLLEREPGPGKETDGRPTLDQLGQSLVERGREWWATEGDATLREGRRLFGPEGKKVMREGRKMFRPPPKALVKEGRQLADEYRGELQAFLDENQPTIEAVERVSQDLASAGRELAASLKFAGREAADELIRRGRQVVGGIDTEEIEDALLEEAIAALPPIERNINRMFYAVGGFFVVMAVVLAAVWFPPLTPYALLLAALASLAVGVVFLRRATTISGFFRQADGRLRTWAAMSSAERRQRLAAHARRGFREEGPEEAEPPLPAGPIPVPVPTGFAARMQREHASEPAAEAAPRGSARARDAAPVSRRAR